MRKRISRHFFGAPAEYTRRRKAERQKWRLSLKNQGFFKPVVCASANSLGANCLTRKGMILKMAFLSSLNIAASGMAAERLRLDVISQNVANAKTTRTEDGTPYKRQVVLFRENKGFDSVLEETIAKRKQQIETGIVNGPLKAAKNKGVLVTEIVEDETPLTPVYDPTHPDADEDGYYYLPNVDVAEEEMDALAATRSYEANLAVLNAVKSMAQTALGIGQQ